VSLLRRLRRQTRQAPFGATLPPLQFGPGFNLVTLSHDAWCKAPVLECTCNPDVVLTRPNKEELSTAVRKERDLRAKIRKTLS
jgi:hypothetical protein